MAPTKKSKIPSHVDFILLLKRTKSNVAKQSQIQLITCIKKKTSNALRYSYRVS